MRVQDIPLLKTLRSKIVFNRNADKDLTVPDARLIILDIIDLYQRATNIEVVLSGFGAYRFTGTSTSLTAGDLTLDCNGTITVTLPPLSTTGQTRDYFVINSGTGVVTIATSGTDILEDVTSFDIYQAEALHIQKGTGKWVVK